MCMGIRGTVIQGCNWAQPRDPYTPSILLVKIESQKRYKVSSASCSRYYARMTFDDPSLLNALFVTSALALKGHALRVVSLTNYLFSLQGPILKSHILRNGEALGSHSHFLEFFSLYMSHTHHSNTKKGLGSGITISTRLGLRFVASVSA